MKKISALILNYNGKRMTDALIKSIYKSNFSRKEYEIIIVDNASTDDSAQFFRKKYPEIKVVTNDKNEGYPGLNNGIRHCNGRYIFIMSNDMEIEKNCFKNILRVIKKNKKSICSPIFYHLNDKSKLGHNKIIFSRSFYDQTALDFDLVRGNRPYEILRTGVFLIEADLARKLDYLFDPTYLFYAEDLDLGLRLRLMGYNALMVPDAIMYHESSTTVVKYFDAVRRTFFLERNLLLTFFKVCSLHSLILFFPYVVFTRLLGMVKDILRLNFRLAFTKVRAFWWCIANIKLVYNKRKEIQKTRKMPDSYVFKLASEREFLKYFLKYLFRNYF